MKNIIMRMGMGPTDNFDAVKTLMDNSIGTNVGNYMYSHSLCRLLTSEGVNITPDYYKSSLQNSENIARYINNNFDCFVIPLADAFRKKFNLDAITNVVKKVKVPCIVIGVGLRAGYEPHLENGFEFDDKVKRFISAVLDKSSMVGVRGEITSDYLTRLGFKEGVHHTAIGCPSLYMYGKHMQHIRENEITKDSRVCFNASFTASRGVNEFILKQMEEFPDYYYIPQVLKELRLMLTGVPFNHKKTIPFPDTLIHPVYRDNRARFFLNSISWIDFLKHSDFSFGSRLHGNIAAVLAGTPSILLTKDARTRELASYHDLTCVRETEITEDTNLFDLIEKADFDSVTKKQGENFDHFTWFLNQNGLHHIFEENEDRVVAPLDFEIDKIDLQPPVVPITFANPKKADLQWGEFVKNYRKMERRIKFIDSSRAINLYLKLRNKK